MKKNEQSIIADWEHEFSNLKQYKGGRKLLCRYGPIVYGIELEKYLSSKYRPKFISLNLLSEYPEFSISRTLNTNSQSQVSVSYSHHSRDFDFVSELMKKQAQIVILETLNPVQVLAQYKEEILKIRNDGASPLAAWFAIIQIALFYGQEATAKREKEEILEYIKSLPKESLAIFDNFYKFMGKELDVSVDCLRERRDKNLDITGFSSICELGC